MEAGSSEHWNDEVWNGGALECGMMVSQQSGCREQGDVGMVECRILGTRCWERWKASMPVCWNGGSLQPGCMEHRGTGRMGCTNAGYQGPWGLQCADLWTAGEGDTGRMGCRSAGFRCRGERSVRICGLLESRYDGCQDRWECIVQHTGA
eukprot:gene15745-biopygen13107